MKLKGQLQCGVSYFPYILLNEIKTMFSQLAQQSLRKLSADTSTGHERYDTDSYAEGKINYQADYGVFCGHDFKARYVV